MRMQQQYSSQLMKKQCVRVGFVRRGYLINSRLECLSYIWQSRCKIMVLCANNHARQKSVPVHKHMGVRSCTWTLRDKRYHLGLSRYQREPLVDLLDQTAAVESSGSKGRRSHKNHPGGKYCRVDCARDRSLCHRTVLRRTWCIPPFLEPLNA